ncbi:MAG: DegT/DnrJ/EryC1/StrS family aminotransferase [Burkholderiales bacterium]
MRSAPIRSKERFLVFGAPKIEQEEIDQVIAVMKSGWLGTGPRVAEFERSFAAYKGVPSAIAVNSCTAALHLSLLAANIRPGDEVITTPLTFCATVNAIIHAGATPILADIDPLTMNIDPKEVARKITKKTRALLPVHFAGRPCAMDEICEMSASHNLTIIEDCAHAVEAEYKGRKVGTLGDFGCFSFYVTKNMTTGEGGMVLARNAENAASVKVLGLHGMSKDAWKRFSDEGYKHYQVVDCGFKYNMMDLQAVIGISQLRRIEKYWQRRQEIWRQYDEAFEMLPLGIPAALDPGNRHGHHLYTILVDEARTGISRDAFLDAMTAHNIGVGVHYLSIPEHPYYRRAFGWNPEDYPHAMRIGRQTVSLPLSAKLTDADVQDVVAAVAQVCKQSITK